MKPMIFIVFCVFYLFPTRHLWILEIFVIFRYYAILFLLENPLSVVWMARSWQINPWSSWSRWSRAGHADHADHDLIMLVTLVMLIMLIMMVMKVYDSRLNQCIAPRISDLVIISLLSPSERPIAPTSSSSFGFSMISTSTTLPCTSAWWTRVCHRPISNGQWRRTLRSLKPYWWHSNIRAAFLILPIVNY